MKNVISAPAVAIEQSIHLPSSKSISNRMLIIRALAGSGASIQNLSNSDDTRVLEKALEENSLLIDVGHAGTSMRFLTAYLSTQAGEFELTGSHRMKQRPVGPLVDALKQLGANIVYLENKGCPPLRIVGGGLKGGAIQMDAGISSQFISALMMIGPGVAGGLQIRLRGEVVSATYINMTLALMNRCGAGARFEGKGISIPEAIYSVDEFVVESDWSGASYWYQVAALLPASEIFLPNLTRESLQGDSVLTELFSSLGVISSFSKLGLLIRSSKVALPKLFEYDFTGCPDLVQTCAVTLCALGIHFRFTGTRTLRVKETDRIAALGKELRKVGFVLQDDPAGEWMAWDGSRCEAEQDPLIATYHDHRMAMAFAPLAITLGKVTIDDPGVVSKSYPGYWNDIEKAGFGIIQA
ncbi:MAG: 3-phosphoshikimate 1-carboxyvinyltransferase [Bacteroidia bacterium]|nr:MAG: 3-phosphoshikimate 1-carboxyvinyltransferase [Bacteroidia bacterium]